MTRNITETDRIAANSEWIAPGDSVLVLPQTHAGSRGVFVDCSEGEEQATVCVNERFVKVGASNIAHVGSPAARLFHAHQDLANLYCDMSCDDRLMGADPDVFDAVGVIEFVAGQPFRGADNCTVSGCTQSVAAALSDLLERAEELAMPELVRGALFTVHSELTEGA